MSTSSEIQALNTFVTTTQEFVALARKVSTAKLHISPGVGEWSAAYVIHHLADSDAYFATRFMNNLSMENPAIVPFDEEAFPGTLSYSSRSVEVSISAIDASCKHVEDILCHIDGAAWKRAGSHPQRGALTIQGLLELTTDHRVGHIDQLKNLL